MWKIFQQDWERLYRCLDMDSEICGVCIPKRGKYVKLLDRNIGPSIRNGGRGSCLSTNQWINYHTHPRLSKPWPSVEDVFNVLYKRPPEENLWGSLIFTEWGIWEIYSPKCYDPDWLDDQLEWWKTQVSYKLYRDLFPTPKSPVPTYRESQSAIRAFIEKWYEQFDGEGLEIILTPWEDLCGDYTLVSSLCNLQL